MARGNCIIVNAHPEGRRIEGFVGSGLTFYPGMAVQIQIATALKGGCHTFEYYAPGADGEMPKGAIFIVLEDSYQGRTVNDSISAGERCFLYCPRTGDELNVLLKDVAGTADDHPAGEKLMIDTGTGKFIATTGTPEEEVAMTLETITDPAADTLAWVSWNR